ncbi:SEC14-like protein 2 [Caerostris extrusa]|uniref:SEC14-like protein 2 n=1 Tax=Caerostris extrusa TaxID=172846 RepID=A0AAV4N3R9_CAEEX|nr:SEC14-like protein 2 [Caerostris extrusa]
MSEEMYADDDLFQRVFLRARGYNLDAAEDMLRKHLQWRKQNKVDTMLEEYKAPEVVEKYLSMNSLGFDKDGYPVNYCEFGNIDTKGLAKCVRKSEINKYMMHHLELDTIAIKKQTEVLGRKVDRWTYIFNFENFSLASATDKTTIEVLIMLVKMYDGNYPERLKTGYLINASFYFTIFWSVVKPFLSAETCRKVKIFGKRYYVHRDRKSFSKLPGVKRLVVNRRSKVNIKLEVNEPGSNIEWDFDLKNRDIGFSLFYEDPQTGKGSEEIVPKQRVDTIIQSESGMLKCDKPGVYSSYE